MDSDDLLNQQAEIQEQRNIVAAEALKYAPKYVCKRCLASFQDQTAMELHKKVCKIHRALETWEKRIIREQYPAGTPLDEIVKMLNHREDTTVYAYASRKKLTRRHRKVRATQYDKVAIVGKKDKLEKLFREKFELEEQAKTIADKIDSINKNIKDMV